MNKVLIITYYWPPGSGPGVQRILKFSKYLSDFGWEPHVLTVKDGTYPSYDESLKNDIPENLKVFKTKTFEPFMLFNFLKGKKGKSMGVGGIGLDKKKGILNRLILYIRANYFIPDARIGWNKYAYKKAVQIIRENKINAIITTGPPHSTHLMGLKLKKRYNISWIADFRDPWTNVYYNQLFPRTKRTEHKDKLLEDTVLKTADYVTVVSHGSKNEFYDRAKNIEVIYNGYDETDMHLSEETQSVTKNFTISYIGNFKPNQNIQMIWKAFRELKQEKEGLKDNFKVVLMGNIDREVKQNIVQYQIEDIVEQREFVPHKEATKHMQSSNLLLFIIPKTNNNHLIITGKLFEYIASKTPIISVGPADGDAAKIISDAGKEKMVSYIEIENFKKNILKYYDLWIQNNGKAFKHENADITRFSRRSLTKRLSELLNETAKQNR